MKTVIIKYNAGNVQSVMYALDRIGASYLLTDDEAEIRSADKVIFPGVGEASTAMAYLRQRGLDLVIPSLKQPVLGTCVGMQLLCRYSEEGDTTCMGVFDVDVRRFPNRRGYGHRGYGHRGYGHRGYGHRGYGHRGYGPRDEEPVFKVPHIGWNNLTSLRGQLTEGLAENSYVYFVHSYCADVCQETTAVCDYVRPFSAMLQKNNFYAAQFHAEISGNVGQRILENFLKI